ncbi:MAG: type II secretion system protein GspM [Alphaproteobacteria bacterium]
MMGLSPPFQKIVAVLLLALLVLLVDAALEPLRLSQAQGARELAQARATLARYRAVADDETAPAATTDALLVGASTSQAAAALQAQIKEAAIAAGARLDSVEALTATEDGRLVLRARLTADTRSLQAMLHRLEAARPVLLIDELYVRARTGRAEGAGLHLDVRFDVIGFPEPAA